MLGFTMTRRKTYSNGRVKYQRFIRLPLDLFESAAFRALSCTERCALLEVWSVYNSYNNGNIGFSCRQLEARLRVSKATACRCFKVLQRHGFLKVVKKGRFTIGHSTTWSLTFEPIGPVAATGEWQSWTPEKQFEVFEEKPAGFVV